MKMNLKLCYLLVSLLLVLDTSTGFDFSDLMNITNSCYSRGKCQTRRGIRLDLDMNWEDVNCFCDDVCIEYGDCCLEANAYDVRKMKTAHSKYECVDIEPFGAFYMRGRCMDGWSSSEISELCLKAAPAESTFSSDPFLDIPATSLKTDITYKNYFCGLCNNETMSDLEMWHAQLSCPEKVDIPQEYMKQNLQYVNESWGFYVNNSADSSFITCDIFPVAKETVAHKIRRCREYLGTCSSNWTNTEVETLCHSYTTLVYGFPPEYVSQIDNENVEFKQFHLYSSFAYRNYHCAICNYIEDKDLTCYERNFRQTPLITPISLSILFDFGDTDTGCEIGEIWNPFSKTCRPVVCFDKQSEFRRGRCIKMKEKIIESTSIIPSLEFENVANSSLEEDSNITCDKMLLNESEFIRTEDGVIKLLSFRRTYDVDEYENYKEGILVCIPNSYSRLMGWLTLFGLGLSCICIVIHLVTFIIVPDLRNLSGKNLASMCVALLIAYICFLVASFKENETSCPIIASLMYYFFLASFSWMNVMAFDVWKTLKRATSELRLTTGKQWKKFGLYSLYAWILPLILLTIIMLFDYMQPDWVDPTYLPELGKRLCWFGQRKAILVYFALPLAIIMAMNIFCFVMAVRMVAPSSNLSNSTCSQTNQVQLKLYLRLALLMGLSWVTGIIGGYLQMEYLWYIFIILNAFQGLFILVSFTCTKKVAKACKSRRALRGSFRRGPRDSTRQVLGYQDSNHSHMSNTSSTNLSTITTQSTITSKSSLGVQTP